MPERRKVNLLYDVEPTVLTLCKQGANRQRIFLKKEQADEDMIALPGHEALIKKAEGDSWSHFYCVVAEPGSLEDPGMGDGHGSGVEDMWRDEEEIRKAAHFFAKSDQLVTGLHDTVEPFGKVVENALAQADFTVVDDSGVEQTIRKGSWYVCIEPSESGKQRIDAGEFTGLSLEGTGFRELADLRKSDGRVREALRTLGAYFSLPEDARLRDDSGTVSATTDSEDDDVDEAQLKKAVGEETEDLRKEVSATSHAITKLTQLVENLATSIDSRKRTEEDEEKKHSPDDLKKAIDGLGEKFAEALDTLEEKVDALADDSSAQHTEGDKIRKQREDNPLAGLLS